MSLPYSPRGGTVIYRGGRTPLWLRECTPIVFTEESKNRGLHLQQMIANQSQHSQHGGYMSNSNVTGHPHYVVQFSIFSCFSSEISWQLMLTMYAVQYRSLIS